MGSSEQSGSTAATGRMQRPPRTYETGSVTRWIRRGTVALTAAVALALLVLYPTLPETIPTHFDFAGRPDAWGPRSSVFLLAGIFIALIGGMTWLSHRPEVFNYPGVVTEHNAQAMYRAGEQVVVWLNGACALVFTGIFVSTAFGVNTAVVIVLGVVGLAGSLIVGLARMLRP